MRPRPSLPILKRCKIVEEEKVSEVLEANTILPAFGLRSGKRSSFAVPLLRFLGLVPSLFAIQT